MLPMESETEPLRVDCQRPHRLARHGFPECKLEVSTFQVNCQTLHNSQDSGKGS